MNLGQLIVSLGVDTKGMNKAILEMEVLARSVSKIDVAAKATTASIANRFEKLGGQLYTFGIRASMYLTAPLVAMGTAIFKTTADFETSMQHIVGLVGESQIQINQWGDELLQLGPKLGQMPKDLAKGLYFITSSGISGAQAMEVLTAAAKASSAGLGSVMQTADLATSVLNAYRGEAYNAAKVMDILVAAVKAGKAEGDSFARTIGQVIPIARALGVRFEDVAAAMASVTLTGSSASQAAVGLKGILTDILDPADRSAEALRKLGISTDQLREMAGRNLLMALKVVAEATRKWGIDAIGRIFPNVRALTEFLSLMGDNFEHNVGIFKEVYSATGAVDRALQAVTETIEHQRKQAAAQFQATWIEIGTVLKEEILPVIEVVTTKIKELGEWFKSLTPISKDLIIRIALITAALGPLTLVLSFLVKFLLPTLIRLIPTVTKVFGALSAVISFSPITASLVALLATIGLVGIGIRKLINHLNDAKEAKEKFDEAMRTKVMAERTPGVAEVAALTERANTIGFMDKSELSKFKRELLDRYNIEYENFENYQKHIKATNDYIEKWHPDATYTRIAEENIRRDQELSAVRKTNMNQLLILYKKVSEELKKRGAEIVPTPILDLSEIDKILNEYKMKIAVSLQKGFIFGGPAVEGMKERLSAARAAFDALTEYQYRTKDASEELNKTIIALANSIKILEDALVKLEEEAKDMITPLQRVMNNYIGALEAIDASAIAGDYSDEMDVLRDKIRLVESTLKQLYRLGERTGFTEALNAEIKRLTETLEGFKKSLRELENMAVFIEVLTQSFFALGKSLVEGKSAWKEFGMAALSIIAQIVEARLVEAFATIFSTSATIAQKEVSKKGLPGLITAAIGIGALMALMSSAKSKASQVSKMKTGGIVPPGYPNDTYPALLTSGEHVIPPRQLAERQMKLHLTVDGETDNRKFYWAVKNYEIHLDKTT